VRHTISVLVLNEFGVLSRVVGMFSGRGYNIDCLNVAPTLDPKISHVTIVTEGEDEIIEQISKQLHKLIDIIKVTDHTAGTFVDREMAMIKIAPAPEQRAEVLRITEIFRGKIVDVGQKSFVIELTGSRDKIEAAAKLLDPLGLREMIRTGPLAMLRGI